MSIRADVDRGLEIVAQMAKLKKELEEIQDRLLAAGLEAGKQGHHVDLKDEERSGKQWLAKGSAMGLPLIFTADKIVASFVKDGAKHQTIRTASFEKLGEFYQPVTTFES